MSAIRSADSPLDRIRQHRQAEKAPILLVEGSPDYRVARRVLSKPVAIFPLGPRAVVLETLTAVLDAGLGPAVALVDRDFDPVVQQARTAHLPVVAYDGADLESALWHTPVLDRSLEELASEPKLAALGGVEAVRSMVDELVRPVQLLRRYNADLGLGLDFDAIDLRQRIASRDLAMSLLGLCDSLRRDRVDIRRSQLLDAATTGTPGLCPTTGLELFRGKDRLAALGVALRRKVGSLGHQEAHVDNVARVFYASVSRSDVGKAEWLIEVERLISA
jgi:hypothetical protein